MSDKQLKNQILDVLSKNMNGGYLNNVGGAMSGGALVGGNLKKEIMKLSVKNLKQIVKDYKVLHNYSYANKSKEELINIIFEIFSEDDIEKFIKEYKKPKKNLSEAQKEVLRERLKKARNAKKVKQISTPKKEPKKAKKEPKKAKKEPKKNKSPENIDKIKKRRELLMKVKNSVLKEILSEKGIKFKSSDNKAQLIELILEEPDIFGGNFFDVLKSIGSTVLDVGKVVAPFVPLIL